MLVDGAIIHSFFVRRKGSCCSDGTAENRRLQGEIGGFKSSIGS